MTPRITLATAGRVLRQLRHDHRTLALVILVPPLLLTIMKYVFYGQEETFDRIGAPLVGIFPFVSMFLVTSIAMLLLSSIVSAVWRRTNRLSIGCSRKAWQ